MAISNNGCLLATGGYDSLITIWNLKKQTRITQPFQAHQGTVRNLIFRPDGKRLVSGGGNTHASQGTDNSVKIWKLF